MVQADSGDLQLPEIFIPEQYTHTLADGYVDGVPSNFLLIRTEITTSFTLPRDEDWDSAFSPATDGSHDLATPVSPYYPSSGTQDANPNVVYSNVYAPNPHLHQNPQSEDSAVGQVSGDNCTGHSAAPVPNSCEFECYIDFGQLTAVLPEDEIGIAEQYGQGFLDAELRIHGGSAQPDPISISSLNSETVLENYSSTQTPVSSTRVTNKEQWPEGVAVKDMFFETEEGRQFLLIIEAQPVPEITTTRLLHTQTGKLAKYWMCNGLCSKKFEPKKMLTKDHAMDHIAAEHFLGLGARFICKKWCVHPKNIAILLDLYNL
ncbi:hypothetical protein M422DRAFT_249095 [Sphaerobolus stellatus SS14]|nr:hypothetical protein M422DRAFT_249095 [Sphaerobolus stellatus SS14]